MVEVLKNLKLEGKIRLSPRRRISTSSPPAGTFRTFMCKPRNTQGVYDMAGADVYVATQDAIIAIWRRIWKNEKPLWHHRPSSNYGKNNEACRRWKIYFWSHARRQQDRSQKCRLKNFQRGRRKRKNHQCQEERKTGRQIQRLSSRRQKAIVTLEEGQTLDVFQKS